MRPEVRISGRSGGRGRGGGRRGGRGRLSKKRLSEKRRSCQQEPQSNPSASARHQDTPFRQAAERFAATAPTLILPPQVERRRGRFLRAGYRRSILGKAAGKAFIRTWTILGWESA